MKSLRSIRGEYEERHDKLILDADEIDLVVESFIYHTSSGRNPEDVFAEAEILQKTLTRSTLYNFKHCHLKIVD